MGRPSDIRRSARRPGRRERARVKNRKIRSSVFCIVGGVGTYRVKAGRKKYRKVVGYCDRVMEAHQASDSTAKSGSVIKRPLYTITLCPVL